MNAIASPGSSRNAPAGGVSREITLTRGYAALVDDADYEALNGIKWSTSGSPQKGLYAVGTVGGRLVRMHRHLLDAPHDLVVDHINGDTLDNRRSNLRVCTFQQNLLNQRRRVRPGFKGVYRSGRRWVARLVVSGVSYGSGTFASPHAAARAVDLLAMEHHGEYACLNFPADRDWLFPQEHKGSWPPIKELADDLIAWGLK